MFYTFNWGIFPSYVSREKIIYAKGYTVTFQNYVGAISTALDLYNMD